MTIEQLAEQALERPDSWADLSGEDFMYITHARTFGTHRDADVLATSNWEVISKDMLERFPDDVRAVESSHWAVGWVEELFVRVYKNDNKEEGFTDAWQAIFEWYEKLESYPVADEEDLSEREVADLDDTLAQSYSVPTDKVEAVRRYLWDEFDASRSEEIRDEWVARAMVECGIPEADLPDWLAKALVTVQPERPAYAPGAAAVKMSTIDSKGQVVESRTIDANACPHLIMVAEHYREDGSCRCNDPEHKVMMTWGYRWKGDHWQ